MRRPRTERSPPIWTSELLVVAMVASKRAVSSGPGTMPPTHAAPELRGEERLVSALVMVFWADAEEMRERARSGVAFMGGREVLRGKESRNRAVVRGKSENAAEGDILFWPNLRSVRRCGETDILT